jgi:peroxiredoxin
LFCELYKEQAAPAKRRQLTEVPFLLGNILLTTWPIQLLSLGLISPRTSSSLLFVRNHQVSGVFDKINSSVVFRGHWCPFCQAYLKSLQSLLPAITAAGGKAIAITAEPEQHLAETRSLTGYTGDVIVDPENQIAAELKRREKLTVAISSKAGYPHGMAQPAILVMQSDGTVLYDWAIVPSVMNLGGAKDRPDLKQVWENAEAKMEGKPKVHQTYDLQSFTKVIWGKLFG